MTTKQAAAIIGTRPRARHPFRGGWAAAARRRWGGAIRVVTVWNYLQLLGGSVGRLGISLLYFLLLTRALDLADFGLFASTVAVGTILSRLSGFGYGAVLFQVSATRPRLLGPYLGTYLVWMVASLPACLAVAWVVHSLGFSGRFAVVPYLCVIASEAVVWRMLDAVSATNSGLGRFGFAASAYAIGTAARALAALAFLAAGGHTLDAWARLYLAANLAALLVTAVALMPRVRPRYRRGTAFLRWRNAIALGGAGLAGSAQAEIDKLLVLSFGGAVTAGLYAICIRVIDLTAVPTRAFNVLMIQRLLKDPTQAAGPRRRVMIEGAIAVVSTATFGGLMTVASLWPGLLGRDVASASGLFACLWMVPALRNLTEYQAELLYGHGKMVATFKVALALTAAKAVLMALLFSWLGAEGRWAWPMTGVFLATYGLSTLMTYRALARSGASR